MEIILNILMSNNVMFLPYSFIEIQIERKVKNCKQAGIRLNVCFPLHVSGLT